MSLKIVKHFAFITYKFKKPYVFLLKSGTIRLHRFFMQSESKNTVEPSYTPKPHAPSGGGIKHADGAEGTAYAVVAWGCCLVALFPALWRLFSDMSKSSQLRDAFIILVSACLALALANGVKIVRPRVSRNSLLWLCAAYALLFCGRFCGHFEALAVFGGLAAAGIAAGLSVVGTKRYVYASGAGFYAFCVLAVFTPFFDLPLRVLAGSGGAKLLGLFCPDVLVMKFGNAAPQIGLNLNGHSFLVATECNGFGIIASCVLIAVVAGFFARSFPLWRRLLLPFAAAGIAYAANVLRIASIVLLAPAVGDKNYFLMHEAVGYFYFFIALVFVWSLCLPKARSIRT